MKRITAIVLLLALSCLLLTGCFCQHEWQDATCDAPMTCAKCGETEGEKLDHEWVDADCLNPKTCSFCGKTRGEAPGHTLTEATCTVAPVCTACGVTEGDVLEHSWVEATTETPKICTSCGLTEGEPLKANALVGSWSADSYITGAQMGQPQITEGVLTTYTFTFTNDGELQIRCMPQDMELFKEIMYEYMLDYMYTQYQQYGFSKAQVDAEVMSSYGMTMEQFVRVAVDATDFTSTFQNMGADGTYRVEGSYVYIDITISDQASDPEVGNFFLIMGDELALKFTSMGGQFPATFTRVNE